MLLPTAADTSKMAMQLAPAYKKYYNSPGVLDQPPEVVIWCTMQMVSQASM